MPAAAAPPSLAATQPLPPPPRRCPADCLPWCTISDGVHVTGTVNDVMLQQLVNMYLLQQAWPYAQELLAAAPAPAPAPAEWLDTGGGDAAADAVAAEEAPAAENILT